MKINKCIKTIKDKLNNDKLTLCNVVFEVSKDSYIIKNEEKEVQYNKVSDFINEFLIIVERSQDYILKKFRCFDFTFIIELLNVDNSDVDYKRLIDVLFPIRNKLSGDCFINIVQTSSNSNGYKKEILLKFINERNSSSEFLLDDDNFKKCYDFNEYKDLVLSNIKSFNTIEDLLLLVYDDKLIVEPKRFIEIIRNIDGILLLEFISWNINNKIFNNIFNDEILDAIEEKTKNTLSDISSLDNISMEILERVINSVTSIEMLVNLGFLNRRNLDMPYIEKESYKNLMQNTDLYKFLPYIVNDTEKLLEFEFLLKILMLTDSYLNFNYIGDIIITNYKSLEIIEDIFIYGIINERYITDIDGFIDFLDNELEDLLCICPVIDREKIKKKLESDIRYKQKIVKLTV